MENLGSMNPEQMFQLFVGSLTCAFIILVFIIVYFAVARRGNQQKRRTDLGRGEYGQDLLSSGQYLGTSRTAKPPMTPASSGPSAASTLPGGEESLVDVSARLAGTGREAWLEETPAGPFDIPLDEEPVPYHGHEILRLVRNSSTGQHWVQMAGVRYRSLNDIRDRAVGQRVMAAITYVLRFSNGMVATDQGVVRLRLPPCDAVKVPTAFGVLSEERGPAEIMRLISNAEQNDFCVHVIDRCYRRLIDVSDQTIGQCILEGIARLLQFSNGALATNDGFGVVPVPSLGIDAYTPLPVPPTPDSHPLPPVSNLGHEPPASLSSSPPAEQLNEEELFLQQLMSQIPPQSQEPVEPPSLRSSFRRMRKTPSAQPLPSLNLADEIDRIFQSKLAASSLAMTDARVESSPDGGVRIRVGMAYYDSPDDVPDPHLRDMLKLSIAEWEES